MKSIRAFELALDQAKSDAGSTASKIDGARRRLNKIMREFEERQKEQIVWINGVMTAMHKEMMILHEELDSAQGDLEERADQPEPGTPPVIEHETTGEPEPERTGFVKAITGGRKR